jgi:hypothetical protein
MGLSLLSPLTAAPGLPRSPPALLPRRGPCCSPVHPDARAGGDARQLLQRAARIMYTSVQPFGSTGPTRSSPTGRTRHWLASPASRVPSTRSRSRESRCPPVMSATVQGRNWAGTVPARKRYRLVDQEGACHTAAFRARPTHPRTSRVTVRDSARRRSRRHAERPSSSAHRRCSHGHDGHPA